MSCQHIATQPQVTGTETQLVKISHRPQTLTVVDLPTDLLLHICGFLSISETSRFTSLNQTSVRLLAHDYVWKKAMLGEFGPDAFIIQNSSGNWASVCRDLKVSLSAQLFNVNPQQWESVWRSLINDSPIVLGDFLRNNRSGFNANILSNFLCVSHKKNPKMLRSFVSGLDFRELPFELAARAYLAVLELPNRQKGINFLIDTFARVYTKQHPGVFTNSDTAHKLFFTIMLLSSDIHCSGNPNKMTLDQFLTVNEGLDEGVDLPSETLTRIYRSVVMYPMMSVASITRIGVLTFKDTTTTSSRLFSRPQKLWCELGDGVLSTYQLNTGNKMEMHRMVFRPVHTYLERNTKRKSCGIVFTLYHYDHRYEFAADTIAEASGWMATIIWNVFSKQLERFRPYLKR